MVFIQITNPRAFCCGRIRILRLKCLKTLDVSGCSKLKNLPDDLGLLVGLEDLHCTGTTIRTIPSCISLLKNLKHLSLRGCNALGSQVSSLNHGQKSMSVNFHNLSGLCSLTMLDLSDCNISDGGILSNLGFLPSLEGLNLDGGLRVFLNFLQVYKSYMLMNAHLWSALIK
ncbi:TMV resistance protein N-like [Lycium ferocissimum]|uniref:TMV resistance protein N-like n=1 Tax=Lycium ferocissimum TaxID=112874 RepID=UPI0028169AF0|nr:TMV resistance protein N-like [Lycium ferocissimum]